MYTEKKIMYIEFAKKVKSNTKPTRTFAVTEFKQGKEERKSLRMNLHKGNSSYTKRTSNLLTIRKEYVVFRLYLVPKNTVFWKCLGNGMV